MEPKRPTVIYGRYYYAKEAVVGNFQPPDNNLRKYNTLSIDDIELNPPCSFHVFRLQSR